jgi:hypothetical protein
MGERNIQELRNQEKEKSQKSYHLAEENQAISSEQGARW